MIKIEIEIHPSVKNVVEFMQKNIPANELRGIAIAVVVIAPAIWSEHEICNIPPMSLSEPEIISS